MTYFSTRENGFVLHSRGYPGKYPRLYVLLGFHRRHLKWVQIRYLSTYLLNVARQLVSYYGKIGVPK